MEATIKKIPMKRNMKGEDIGKAVINSFVYDYIHRDDQNYQPLYTPEDIQRMTLAMNNQYEMRVYSEYINLYHGIVNEFNRAQGALQQAQSGYYILYVALDNAMRALMGHSFLMDFAEEYNIPTNTDQFSKLYAKNSMLFENTRSMYHTPARRKEICTARDTFLYPALHSLQAYNTLLTLVSSTFDLPHIYYLGCNTEYLTNQFLEFNQQREYVYGALQEIFPEDTDLFKELIPPLDPTHGGIAPEAEQAVLEKLKNPSSYEGGSLQRLLLELIAG